MSLDYEKYPSLGREPNTLHEHFRVNPMGTTSYPKWIEDRVWELFLRPGRLECFDARTGRWWIPTYDGKAPRYVGECLQRYIEDPIVQPNRCRIVLATDGTIIKEWHN